VYSVVLKLDDYSERRKKKKEKRKKKKYPTLYFVECVALSRSIYMHRLDY
jgi:hypothetical protein